MTAIVEKKIVEKDSRHDKISSFLLTSLRRAAGRYAAATESFNAEVLALRGVPFEDLDEEDQDYTLADRVVDLCELSQSSSGYAGAAVLIAAFTKENPRRNFRTAWRCLETWRRRFPSAEAPAMPADLALGICNWLVLADRPRIALGVLVCFAGLLRCSEALALKASDLHVTREAVVLVLGQTKRGVMQKIVLECPSIRRWILQFLLRCPTVDDEKLVATTYSTFSRWLRRAAEALGMGHVEWSSHSLRRGGATELQRRNVPLADIMLFGRWLSTRSAREYLRKGDVALMRAEDRLPTDTADRMRRFACLGDSVWGC